MTAILPLHVLQFPLLSKKLILDPFDRTPLTNHQICGKFFWGLSLGRFEHLAVFASPSGNGQALRPARVEGLRELLIAGSSRSPFCCNLRPGRSVNLECSNVRFGLKQMPQ